MGIQEYWAMLQELSFDLLPIFLTLTKKIVGISTI